MLIQVRGDASVLVLLVGVVVVRDVHVAIFNLFLFPPGLNNFEYLFVSGLRDVYSLIFRPRVEESSNKLLLSLQLVAAANSANNS